MKTDMELTVRPVENGYIVLDEKGREFVWHNWRACEQSMAEMFDAAESRRGEPNELTFDPDRARKVIQRCKEGGHHEAEPVIPMAFQGPAEGLTEKAKEGLERAKAST